MLSHVQLPDHLTTAEVAEIFRVTEATVTTWVRDGKLKASRTPGGKSYLFRREDVDAFLAPVAPTEVGS